MSVFKLDPALIPFLKRDGDHLVAKATVAGTKVVLELDKGVSVTLPKKELGIDFGKSLSAGLVFTAEGALNTSVVGPEPQETTPVRRGSAERVFQQQ